ncbi:Uncharacterized protein OBRU01_07860 [Operophtera brumata]|uniref:Uncharacterized protein n=1 Tax=Operophtera brumata TaxID=104452 RepID=A0A0L7LIV7_OPEBR|nr:Uncharacterized protein OBRU01_07860 [Operophtera brumata]
MDTTDNNRDENIRKIEDIIDIQKANGSFSMRQVAFNLPSLPTDSESNVSAGIARSLESGLSTTKSDGSEKIKLKKARSKRHRSPMPDVISWPSDSDITVLRMKLCLSNDIKEKVVNIIPGDGLHQPDGSSMVNLATLMRQSQTASKHSINIEEYLLPLTSWEGEPENKNQIAEEKSSHKLNLELGVIDAACNRQKYQKECYNDSDMQLETTKKSKIAKFLRLYFCPCCSCLYKMEKMKMLDG